MKLIDLTGQRFGKLVVLGRVDDKGLEAKWLCKCDCGREKIVTGHYLRNGKVTHCGCERIDCESKTRLKNLYKSMVYRCNNEKDKNYKSYGGRGISVCEEWMGECGFQNFKKWAYENGYDENKGRKEQSLDRIDNNKGYSPDNCRWVSMKIQSNNKRTNAYLIYKGERHTKAEWAEIIGIPTKEIDNRLKRGKTVTEAFETPLKHYVDRANREIRCMVIGNKITHIDIASKIGVHPVTITKWMKKPLDKDKEEKIRNAIQLLINEKE